MQFPTPHIYNFPFGDCCCCRILFLHATFTLLGYSPPVNFFIPLMTVFVQFFTTWRRGISFALPHARTAITDYIPRYLLLLLYAPFICVLLPATLPVILRDSVAVVVYWSCTHIYNLVILICVEGVEVFPLLTFIDPLVLCPHYIYIPLLFVGDTIVPILPLYIYVHYHCCVWPSSPSPTLLFWSICIYSVIPGDGKFIQWYLFPVGAYYLSGILHCVVVNPICSGVQYLVCDDIPLHILAIPYSFYLPTFIYSFIHLLQGNFDPHSLFPQWWYLLCYSLVVPYSVWCIDPPHVLLLWPSHTVCLTYIFVPPSIHSVLLLFCYLSCLLLFELFPRCLLHIQCHFCVYISLFTFHTCHISLPLLHHFIIQWWYLCCVVSGSGGDEPLFTFLTFVVDIVPFPCLWHSPHWPFHWPAFSICYWLFPHFLYFASVAVEMMEMTSFPPQVPHVCAYKSPCIPLSHLSQLLPAFSKF